VQMVGTNPSTPHPEIAASRTWPSQPLFFQFYKNSDDRIAESMIRKIEDLGYSAIFLTVDAPILGKRERDERAPFEEADEESEVPAVWDGLEEIDDPNRSISSAFSKQDDPNKTWEKVILLGLMRTKTDSSILDDTLASADHEASDCPER
jgi:L-lactate dehydrogenase (cytochrome)